MEWKGVVCEGLRFINVLSSYMNVTFHVRERWRGPRKGPRAGKVGQIAVSKSSLKSR
jgi:hypothetical protein